MRTLIAVAMVLTAWTPVPAFCLHPEPKVCSEFFASDAVVQGTVTSIEVIVDREGFTEGWNFHLRVDKTYRGTPSPTAVAHTSNDSGRRMLEQGKTYVLFASRENGRLEIGDDCGPLSDPKQMPDVIAQIEKLAAAKSAVVEGEVVAGTATGPGRPGVPVAVTGGGKTYRTATDAHGSFRLEVPPGRYSVAVDPTIATVSDISVNRPEGLELTAGQCAQIQFVAPGL